MTRIILDRLKNSAGEKNMPRTTRFRERSVLLLLLVVVVVVVLLLLSSPAISLGFTILHEIFAHVTVF